MSARTTLAEQKRELRAHYREVRSQIPPRQKMRWDSAIQRHFLALEVYRDCLTLLGYLPLAYEIDTLPLLEDAWRSGKQVAVPYCVPDSRRLDFYLIDSLEQLSPGTYGVLEPNPSDARLLRDFSGSLCLVPGLAFDRQGYRLGHGGGYYDRFLSGPFAGHTAVGACYGSCTVNRLARGAFDMPCGYLVTETGTKHTVKP